MESFVVKNTKNEGLELAFDIVKHVINTRLAEDAKRKEQADNKKKNEKILSIIEKKQDEELEGQDIESLKSMLV